MYQWSGEQFHLQSLCQTINGINDHFWIRCVAMPHAMAGKNWGCCTEISGSQLGYLISLKCGAWQCFCSSMPQWLLQYKINDEPPLLMLNYKAHFLPISSNGCGPCFLIVFTALLRAFLLSVSRMIRPIWSQECANGFGLGQLVHSNPGRWRSGCLGKSQ